MAFQRPGEMLSGHTASADLSTTGQFLAVSISGANTVDVADGTSEEVVGVLQNDPALGAAAMVMTTGLLPA